MNRTAKPVCCVLHARSSKDAHDIAPATQLKELRAYSATRRYTVVAEYQDAAISANANPPQLGLILKKLDDANRGWSVICAIDSSHAATTAP